MTLRTYSNSAYSNPDPHWGIDFSFSIPEQFALRHSEDYCIRLVHTRPEDDFRFLATKQKVSRFAGKKNAMLWWWLVNFKRTLISWWRRHERELLSPRRVAYSRFLWLRFYPEMTAKLKCKEPRPGTWSVTIGSQLVPCCGTTLFRKSWRVPPWLVNSIKPTTQRTAIIKITRYALIFQLIYNPQAAVFGSVVVADVNQLTTASISTKLDTEGSLAPCSN